MSINDANKMNTKHPQSGLVMLEGLIAILIFSMAILGVVGMQAIAIGKGTEAQHRADAAFLANQLLGQMWAHAGSGVYITQSNVIVTEAQAIAAGFDITGKDAAPNLYNYHCISCTVATATAAGIQAGDPEFANWLRAIQGTGGQIGFLPGVADNLNQPNIDVHCSTADGGASYPTCPAHSATQVTITLFWQKGKLRPGEQPHQYTTLSEIKPN